MNPQLRQALVMVVAMVLAAWAGLQIADASYFWPGLAAGVAMAAILARLLSLSFDVILLGMVVFGYLAGNRGFAQLMPAPGLPLLPAEIALGVALGWRTALCALRRESPVGRDLLSLAVLAWLIVGGSRFALDLPQHGLNAVRDFATVYYAAFFLLVLHMAREGRARRFLLGCLIAGLLILPVTFSFSQVFPVFFNTAFTVHGAPLIFFKGDLAFTCLAAGALLVFFHAGNRVPPWAWVVSAAFSLSVMNSDSRSSLAGLLFACLLLLAARRWLFPLWQGALLGSVLLVVVGLATLGDSVWAQRKLHGVADRMRSMVDFRGEGTYHSEESHYKGSNNRFRAVWWRNVLRETWQTNPAFGLGFGHDLAAGFLQEYYPESSVEEFTARSPHNIFITVFGRMGLVGLVPWFAICLAMLARTWRSLRHSENRPAWAQWCALWVLLVSATFGVVLEGPMGAVPFWVLLGLASVQNEVAATEKTASGAA